MKATYRKVVKVKMTEKRCREINNALAMIIHNHKISPREYNILGELHDVLFAVLEEK